jgi:hypothetical protein
MFAVVESGDASGAQHGLPCKPLAGGMSINPSGVRVRVPPAGLGPATHNGFPWWGGTEADGLGGTWNTAPVPNDNALAGDGGIVGRGRTVTRAFVQDKGECRIGWAAT